jgi:hypothetical protein
MLCDGGRRRRKEEEESAVDLSEGMWGQCPECNSKVHWDSCVWDAKTQVWFTMDHVVLPVAAKKMIRWGKLQSIQVVLWRSQGNVGWILPKVWLVGRTNW